MPEVESIASVAGGAVRARGGAEAASRDDGVAREREAETRASEEASREFVRALLAQAGLTANGATRAAEGVASRREALLSSEFVRTGGAGSGGAGSGPSELLHAAPERGLDHESWSRSGEGSGRNSSGTRVEARSVARGAEAGATAPGQASGARGDAVPRGGEGTASSGSERADAARTGASGDGSREGGVRTSASRVTAALPAGATTGSSTGSAVGRAVGTGGAGGAPSVGSVSGPGAGAGSGGAAGPASPLVVREGRAGTTPRGAGHAPRETAGERVQLQFAHGLAAALRSAGKEITLRLTPEALGEVRVRVRFEDGGVVARFEAREAGARALLEDSVGTLRGAMESRGLQVERIEIGAGPEGGGAGDRGARESSVNGRDESSDAAGDRSEGRDGEGRGDANSSGEGAAGREDHARGGLRGGAARDAVTAGSDGGARVERAVEDGVVRVGVAVLGVDALA